MRLFIISAFAAQILLLGVGRQESGTPPPPTCTPGAFITSHPRGFLNECERADELEKYQSGGSEFDNFQGVITAIDSNWSTLGVDCPKEFRCSVYALSVAMAYNLYDDLAGEGYTNYQSAHTKAAYLAKVVEIFDSAENDGAFPPYVPNTYNGVYYGIAADLAWDGFTTGEKTTIAAWFTTVEDNNPDACDAHLGAGDNLYNSQVYVCRTAQTGMALVLKGTGFETAWTDPRYAAFDDYFTNSTYGIVAYDVNFLGLNGGLPPEGQSYGWGYDNDNGPAALEMYRRAHYIDAQTFYDTSTFLAYKTFPYNFMNTILPFKEGGSTSYIWSAFRIGPRYPATDNSFIYGMHSTQTMFSWDPTTAGYAKWIEDNVTGNVSSSGIVALAYGSLNALLGPITIPTPLDPTTASAPLGVVGNYIASIRNAWTGTDTGLVEIGTQKWQGSSTHRIKHPGAVYLSRNGVNSFAIGDYSNSMQPETWAGFGNGMAFPNRSVDIANGINDNQGTAREVYGAAPDTSLFVDGSTIDIRKELRSSFATTELSNYVGQDLLWAYDNSHNPDPQGGGTVNPDRISSYWKHIFVSVQSDRTLVMQHNIAVSVSTAFRRTEFIRMPLGVTLNGTESGYNRYPSSCSAWVAANFFECATNNQGIFTSTNSSKASVVVNASPISGALFFTSILPATRTMNRVGGPTAMNQDYHATTPYSQEGMDFYGVKRYPNIATITTAGLPYVPSWRIEVEETTPTTNAPFLSFIEQCAAHTCTESTLYSWTAGTGFSCLGIDPPGASNNVIWCSGISTTATQASGTMILANTLTAEGMFCGFGKSVSRTLTPGSNIDLGSGAGVAITPTTTSAGCVRITTVTVSGSGSGANNTITVS